MSTAEIIDVEADGEAPEQEQSIPATSSLANRATVRELVAVFASAEADIRRAFSLIHDAEKRLNAAFMLGETLGQKFDVNANRHEHWGDDYSDPEIALVRLRRHAWRVIVDRLEIRRAMSLAKAKELEEHLEKGEPMAITEENVVAFVQRFAEDLPEMFAAAVKEVFEWLRPWPESHRGQYKTNEKNARLEIGSRVVLTYMVERSHSGRGRFSVRYGYGHGPGPREHLTALWNVFSMLDGQGIGEKTARSPLENAIETSPDGTGGTLYFRFRCFKNGNLHLEFTRSDLLARFNQIAGGKRLRPDEDRAA